MWLRNEGRLFGVVFVLFNVLLAVFNVLNYRVTSRATVPCVVIVAPTPAPDPRQQHRRAPLPAPQARTAVPVPPSLTWTDPVSENQTASTTPHTRILLPRNATEPEESYNYTSAWDTEIRDKYTIVKRYIPADGFFLRPSGFDEGSVTLSTQGTFEFLHHVSELCSRWDGPLSVSVYAPGTDLPVAVRKILFLRRCGPICVRTNVTWHLAYETVLAPVRLESPEEMAELEQYEPFNCSAGFGPLELVSEIRSSKKLPYPINVARNVARQLATTRYVLASDIELYPSLNIVQRFLQLVSRLAEKDKNAGIVKPRRVFTFPIFEIKKNFSAPKTKAELVKRVKDGHAIFFHKWVCDACQNFPRRDQWLRSLPPEDSLGVFEVTKRQMPRTAWEPIYIGTNEEPLYDERLTWEGKRDKMSQMYELCLMDYDFYVLDNAFLVHAPGIKTLSNLDQRRRAPFMYKNNAVHNKLLAQMKKKYGSRKGC
ncbi:hypothetical protein JTE90_019756 [Oedothorax gibbosus]|uniref:N-acetyllactosaminide beta-1,3-N-acetylglucosaminyltransferase n=1 Tax=Oedothorax gibbosus TaxID=931172 RepID=A0AAV6UP45_9ARAC|nr:hypothetical protein JTE90_019756 [Oedothorax gibbosus]